MSLEEKLAERLRGVVVVMGIGNPLRGDDAAGGLVARRIAVGPGVFAIDAGECPENYLTVIANHKPDSIVLVDSVDMRSEPGSAALLKQEEIAGYWPTTHRTPLSLLISVLERSTGASAFAIGIQPAQVDFMQPISEGVAASIPRVAGILNRAIAATRGLARSAASNCSRGGV